ncbi:MAG: MFS transporter [Candidatus Hydrogenedentes bacterium]|nr:MFS transporter [Candidatus Hydrogenedentota bacterium]
MNRLPRTVVVLGVASLFTDMSSEMIYPLLPLFLTTTLGASALALGVIEGIAETTASVLKIASGYWTDRVAKRKPFILAGYGLAGIVRPLIGLAAGWPFVLTMRFLDRIGKGLRTSPRDALIADSAEPGRRGQAYGFHRSMDHAGAVLGPLIAAALLTFAGFSLRTVFLLAAIPAAIVLVVLIVGVKENPSIAPRERKTTEGEASWGLFDRNFRLYLAALLVFTLGNSTDAFILLRLSNSGVPEAWIAILWALHHIVKMVFAYAGGTVSDTLGRRRVILLGWFVYALVYLAFGMLTSPLLLVGVFLVYGLYFGLTEPCEKAWVADLAPAQARGAALGWYNGIVGIAALPASLLFGFIWDRFGIFEAFATGAGFALCASILLLFVRDGTREPARS